MTQNEICSLGATRINIGLSAIIAIAPGNYQYAESFKILSGGGTLEIVPRPLALTGTSTTGWGLGYPLGASEVFNVGGPAVMYLAATGATMVLSMILGYTSGATIL